MSQVHPVPFPALLSVRDLSVQVGATRHVALDGLSFEMQQGERVALLGPSGCGKTTLLHTIAGFEHPATGSITLAGRLLCDAKTHVPPHLRSTGMVFQDYALFPHFSVLKNVAFGLAQAPREERARRVAEVIERVGLSGFEARMPGELSGGQQQRVALARALAPEPRLILLDEPFSSLDSNLRATTRRHTEQVLTAASATALLVTHDQSEAMSFAERLLVLRQGKLEQAGSPEQVYRSPRNAFVASFVGAANLLPGEAQGDYAITALGKVALQRTAQGSVSLCLRPEAIRLSTLEEEPRVRIVSREYQGSASVYRVRGENFDVTVSDSADVPFNVGDTVSLKVILKAAVLEDAG